MAIRVTCPNCHTRFNVSDKFAGKEGPCPKCKKAIRVPDKTEEVVIEAPEDAGPKDSKGRPVLSPIKRQETVLSSVQITLIAVCIIGFLLAALMLRMMMEGDIPVWLLTVAAIAIAPPIAYVGYHLMRDSELGTFNYTDLRNRVVVASSIYAVLWFAMPISRYAFSDSYEMTTWIAALVAMLGIGGATGMFAFDLDYILGLVHYGMYLGICLVGRWLAGIGLLPGMNAPPANTLKPIATSWLTIVEQWPQQICDLSSSFSNYF